MNHVLVIDSSRALRRLQSQILSGMGYHVHTAATADEGWVLCRQLQPALATVHWVRPNLDGELILKAIREAQHATRVLVLTTPLYRRVAITAMQQGAHDYLLVPFAAESLQCKARRLIEQCNQVSSDDAVR